MNDLTLMTSGELFAVGVVLMVVIAAFAGALVVAAWWLARQEAQAQERVEERLWRR